MNQIEKFPLTTHLNDLKRTLFHSVIIWIIASVGMFLFYEDLISFVSGPITSKGLKLHSLAPADSLLMVFKLCSLAGFLLSMPFISYFIWEFIKVGFTRSEQKIVSRYVFASMIFSTIGVVFAYIFLIPTTLGYLLDFIPGEIVLMLTTNEYLNFLYGILLIMMLVFQTPVIVFGLIKSGIVPKAKFKKIRREFYFGTIVFMAIFGGQDIISLAITTIPVIFMFEAAIFLA